MRRRRRPWMKVRNKLYIWVPWVGEIQVGLKWHNVAIWHRGKLYKIYTSRKTKAFMRGE